MRSTLEELAREVRDKVMEYCDPLERSAEVAMGADGTPTCMIDKLAEDVIIDEVERRGLPFNILSEEAGFIDREYDQTLVIDPVDGTYNSLMGIPFYSVSLAIGRDGLRSVTHGLVRNIVTGDTFYAEKGKGAELNGRSIEVRPFRIESSTVFVYIGRYSTDDNFRLVRKARRSRSMGCVSLEMCLVASGMGDAYFIRADTYEKSLRVIDIAASTLILREAGGEVYDLNGERLEMPFDLKARANIMAVGDDRVRGWAL